MGLRVRGDDSSECGLLYHEVLLANDLGPVAGFGLDVIC